MPTSIIHGSNIIFKIITNYYGLLISVLYDAFGLVVTYRSHQTGLRVVID